LRVVIEEVELGHVVIVDAAVSLDDIPEDLPEDVVHVLTLTPPVDRHVHPSGELG